MENNLEHKMNAIAEIIMNWFGLVIPIILFVLGLIGAITTFIQGNLFGIFISFGMMIFGFISFKEFYNELKNK